MLREADRAHRRKICELKASNEELCSIIRHALEDMQREKVCLTNALHDRIERHAPSALASYIAGLQPHASSSNLSKDAPRNSGRTSQGPISTVHECSEAFESISASVPATRQHASARVDTYLSGQRTTKRQRRGVHPCEDDWDCQPSISPKPLNQCADSFNKDMSGAFTTSASNALASEPTNVQDAGAFAFTEPLPRRISHCDVMPWQQDFQQASMSWMYNDTDLLSSCATLGGDVQPKSPMFRFDFNPKHSMADLSHFRS